MTGTFVFRSHLSFAAALLALAAIVPAFAGPQLTRQCEKVAGGALRCKVLANAVGVPAPTPAAQTYVCLLPSGAREEMRVYSVRDLWRLRAFAGEWRDRKNNVMRLWRVRSRCPTIAARRGLPEGLAAKSDIEAALDAAEKSFTGDEKSVVGWCSDFGNNTTEIIRVRASRDIYALQFEFAEEVKSADLKKLCFEFARSASVLTGGVGNHSSLKWWEVKNGDYRFITDLDRARGNQFVRDAMRTLQAMRRCYAEYVPAGRKVGTATVRVFKNLASYREYRASTGHDDNISCGLWDPNREELLIVADNRAQAQATMRHEGFHQYLHTATGRGDHAMWFNEGHATFFESMRYDSRTDSAHIVPADGDRAKWAAAHVDSIVANLENVTSLDYDRFYSGSIDLNYATAWALVTFLHCAPEADRSLGAYSGVLPAYLERMAAGDDAKAATAAAFKLVEGRNLADDFRLFWKRFAHRLR